MVDLARTRRPEGDTVPLYPSVDGGSTNVLSFLNPTDSFKKLYQLEREYDYLHRVETGSNRIQFSGLASPVSLAILC